MLHVHKSEWKHVLDVKAVYMANTFEKTRKHVGEHVDR